MKKVIITKSEKETKEVATKFSKTLGGGEVILLEGDLGSGKSTFVRGLAKAFGIREPVRSPTFTLMHIHKIRKQLNPKRYTLNALVHIDAYRLGGAEDLRSIGIEEYLGRKDAIIVIEWGKKVSSLFKKFPVININFKYGKKISDRKISYERH